VYNDLTFPIYCFVARVGYLPSSVNHMGVFEGKKAKRLLDQTIWFTISCIALLEFGKSTISIGKGIC